MVNTCCSLSSFQESQIISHFFFFQAEDGIRDHCVTGVQTCALPISDSEPEPDLAVVRGCACRKSAISPRTTARSGSGSESAQVMGCSVRTRQPRPTKIGRASCRERV